jgi:hypothetical protein
MSDHLPFESQPQAQDSQVAAGDRSPGVVTPFRGSKTTNGATPERPPDTAYGYGPADGVLGAGGQLSDYVRLVYKRRNTGFLAFALVAALVLGYTFTATPIFEARTQLLLEVDNQNVVSFKEVVEQGQANTDYYQTQYRILQSRSLARRTLDTRAALGPPAVRSRQHLRQSRRRSAGLPAWVGGLFGGGERRSRRPRTRRRRSRWPSTLSEGAVGVAHP